MARNLQEEAFDKIKADLANINAELRELKNKIDNLCQKDNSK
jgi:hypothetical protein